MDVVTLDLSDQGLTDASQIFIAEGVTRVFLSNNELTDVSDLKLPSTLKLLALGRNQISSIDSLRLPNGLETLIAGANPLQDISNANLPDGLKELFLANSQFDSFEDLGILPDSLETLSIIGNQIAGGIFDAPLNLNSLDMSDNPVSKVSEVTINNAPNLRNLIIFDANITDISDIGDFQVPNNRFSLSLGGNEITDLSPLVNATGLAGFSFGVDSLTSLAGITLPPNLIFLDLGGGFTSLDGLVYNDKLEVLGANAELTSISSNQIPSTLKKLNLSDNNISDFSALTLPANLEVLDIARNPVDEPSNLPLLPANTRRVNFTNIGLSSLGGFTFPKKTRLISLDDNGISNLPRKFIPRGSKLRKIFLFGTGIPRDQRKQTRKRIRRRASRAKVKFNDLSLGEFSEDFQFN